MMLRICHTDSVQQIAQPFFLAGIAQAQSKNPRNSLRTLRRKIALLQSHFMKQKPRCWESPIVSYCGTWSTCFWRYAWNLQCYSLDGQILHITYRLNILWHHGLFVEHPNSFSIAQWLHIIVQTRLSKWIDDMHAMNRDASTNFIASCPWSNSWVTEEWSKTMEHKIKESKSTPCKKGIPYLNCSWGHCHLESLGFI